MPFGTRAEATASLTDRMHNQMFLWSGVALLHNEFRAMEDWRDMLPLVLAPAQLRNTCTEFG